MYLTAKKRQFLFNIDRNCLLKYKLNNICELINKSNAPVDPEVNTSEAIANGGNSDYGNGTWGRVDPMYRTVSFGLQVTF